jgi:hypothetical protein
VVINRDGAFGVYSREGLAATTRLGDLSVGAEFQEWRVSNEHATPLRRVPIPVKPAAVEDACAGAEPFALMVLGHSMEPEFQHGDIVVIEPDGLVRDGSFVLAHAGGEWMLRRIERRASGWALTVLAGSEPAIEIADLASVRGVVIQRSRGGRRRDTKRYVE